MKLVFLSKGSRGDVEPLLALALAFHSKHPATEIIIVCSVNSINGLEDPLAKEKEWLKLHHLPEPHEIPEKLESDVFKQRLLNREVKCCVDICSNGVDGMIFNLFSLEGYLIANHFRIPSVAVSPFLVTRTPPKLFEKRFAQEHPFIYSKLKESAEGILSYKDVDHWMWRLFLDDISTACDAAGISSFPLPYPAPSSFTPPTHTPSMSPSSSWSLPRPTKLLYGISPAIVPREHFWPESVHLCGFWKLPCDWCGGMDDGRMVEFVESHCGRLAYTGFGSMEKYLNDVDWNKLLCTLNEVVIHHGGTGTVSSAIMAGVPQIVCPVMFDQVHWGHIIEWKGLGKLVNTGPSNLTFDCLHKAILAAMNEEVKMCLKRLKETVNSGNGLESAVRICEKELCT